MSDKNRRPKSTTKNAPRTADTSQLQSFLDTLDLVRPTVHVNGIQHPTAVITVDLGVQPNARLGQEQSQELVSRLRRVTRDLYRDEMNIRVSFDTNNGICWSSVA